MYRKAKELFENCGVQVTLVTHYRGVYHFYNTAESGIKTVFEEYLEAFAASPESFVVEVPDISAPADKNKKTQDTTQARQHGKTKSVDALEVDDFLVDIGDLEMNMADMDEIDASFYGVGSILPAIVTENKIMPTCRHSVPDECHDIGQVQPCKTMAASVHTCGQGPVVDRQRVDKQAHKEARIEARKEARIEARKEARKKARKEARKTQENNGQKMPVATKPHASALCISKCNKNTPKTPSSNCVQNQNTATANNVLLRKGKHAGLLSITKDIQSKESQSANHVPLTTIQDRESTREKKQKRAKMAKTAELDDDIASWLANIKESFAQEEATPTIQRNDPIFAMFTKF